MDDTPADEQLLHEAFRKIGNAVLPLRPELRERAHAMLGAFLGITAPKATQPALDITDPNATQPAGHRSPPPIQIASRESPKDFLFQKEPDTDVERVACLAYYLTHRRDTNHFKTVDISRLNTEAAQRKFANTATSVNNAVRGGFLAPVGQGKKQLTAQGERYVDTLPDRAAARAALGKRRPRRQRRQSATGKAPAAAQEQAE